MKPSLVFFDSPEGIASFQRSGLNSKTLKLINCFETQAHPTYCGIAVATILLNTLKKTHHDEHYTQEQISAAAPKSRANIRGETGQPDTMGLTLQELNTLLNHYGFNSQMIYVDDLTKHAEYKNALIKATFSTQAYAVINYQRNALAQAVPGGHFALLGAYDKVTDRFLILDTYGPDGTWLWVLTDDLIKALHTQDLDTFRGYLIVA